MRQTNNVAAAAAVCWHRSLTLRRLAACAIDHAERLQWLAMLVR